MSLETLKVKRAPIALSLTALKHNALVAMLGNSIGRGGVNVTISEGRIIWEVDVERLASIIASNPSFLTALATALVANTTFVANLGDALLATGSFYDSVTDLARDAAPVQSVNGFTGVVELSTTDLTDVTGSVTVTTCDPGGSITVVTV